MSLIAQIEASQPDDQRELLVKVWQACNGGVLFARPATPEFRETHDRWDRFRRMLDANAFESAALMMALPEWWFSTSAPLSPSAYGYSREDQRTPRAGFEMIGEPYSAGARAPTIALAIAAACLRARGLS